MGCSNSTPVHPDELIRRRDIPNGNIKVKAPPEDEVNANHMKGDYSQFQLAKHNREKLHKDRQFKLFMAADEMSGKVMEDREMLSLGTRSRGTSRNTSRGTSPTGNKRGHQADQKSPMTPVAELSRGASLRSLENLQADATPKKKHKSHKHSKNKTKSKKHKKGKKSKKGKSSKDKDDSDQDDLDSGLEEEDDDLPEHLESDKENNAKKNQTKNHSDNSRTKEKHKGGAKLGEPITVAPVSGSVNSAQTGVSPLQSSRSIKDVKMQSASKDSGIAETGAFDSHRGQVTVDNNNRHPEERSDSRV